MMVNKRLIGLCKESKRYIIFTVIANWIVILCNIFIILLIGRFITRVSLGDTLNISGKKYIISALLEFKVTNNISLLSAMIIIIGLLGLRYLGNILYGKYSYLASAEARVTLRDVIYKKLLKIGTRYTDIESTSAIVQVAVEGVEALEIYFGKYLPQLFYSMLAPLTLFIVMCFISYKVAIVFILSVPLIPISIIAIMKIAKRILKEYWNSYANLGDTFLDNLQGLTTLKVFNMDEEIHRQMNEEAETFRKITMKVLSMQLNSINVMDLIAFGGAALGIIMGFIQFRQGHLDIGQLLVIILLSSEFFIPLRLLGSFFHIAMNGMAASDRIFKILDTDERKAIREEKNKKSDFEKKVEVSLKDVSFSYDGEREVLKHVNMNITPKGLVAIVGESGSGKSTIASLILNTYKVTSGKITLDKNDINEMKIEEIYEKISLVSTNSYIFNGTLLDNLLMGNAKATMGEVEEALKIARLDDFVRGLKDGINTKVGEGGSLLSGGQKQRLALARVILGNRNMIIFDEATSNIDVDSEEDIWQAIYDLSKIKTILVISHRLANVKAAKKIYVMKQGELVEEGTHEELLKSKKEYYKMIERQSQLEAIREVE